MVVASGMQESMDLKVISKLLGGSGKDKRGWRASNRFKIMLSTYFRPSNITLLIITVRVSLKIWLNSLTIGTAGFIDN